MGTAFSFFKGLAFTHILQIQHDNYWWLVRFPSASQLWKQTKGEVHHNKQILNTVLIQPFYLRAEILPLFPAKSNIQIQFENQRFLFPQSIILILNFLQKKRIGKKNHILCIIMIRENEMAAALSPQNRRICNDRHSFVFHCASCSMHRGQSHSIRREGGTTEWATSLFSQRAAHTLTVQWSCLVVSLTKVAFI